MVLEADAVCWSLQILDVLNTASNEGLGGKGRRERPDPARRHTAVTCVCAAALAGLDTLARKFRGKPTLTDAASPFFIKCKRGSHRELFMLEWAAVHQYLHPPLHLGSKKLF